MNIRMLETRTGAKDHLKVEQFKAEQVYNLGHTPAERELAAIFLQAGWAEEVADREGRDATLADAAATGEQSADGAAAPPNTPKPSRRKRA